MKQEQTTKIKLAVVDDHTLFRQGLLKILQQPEKIKNGCTVLFDVPGSDAMKEKIERKNLPDIVLMDIDMDEGDGFEGVNWLKQYYPEVKVLVVSMINKEDAMLRMLRMGVRGYLTKDIEAEDIYEAVDVISKGGYYYTDYITGHLLEVHQHDGQPLNTFLKPGSATAQLTETERTFLKWVCTDFTYAKIAEEMNLSFKTIDDYREKLFKKLQVKTRVTLALYAVKHGLVQL
jgi:two-component system, NarL family, invasion response regulator UvrY